VLEDRREFLAGHGLGLGLLLRVLALAVHAYARRRVDAKLLVVDRRREERFERDEVLDNTCGGESLAL